MTRRSACQSPPAAPVKSLGAAARGAPGRDRAAPLRPRGGPCSSGLIHPALLTQQPAAAVRSLLRTGPLCPVFSTLAPRCVRALAERGPTGSSRAHRVGDSWLKPCSRLCRGLCAWRGPFRCAVGEEGVSRPHGGSACSRRCSAPFCPHAPFHVFADTPMAHQPCRAVLCGVFGDFWGSHGPECSRNRALGVIGWCRRPSLLLLSDVTRARAIDHGRAHGL